MLGCDLYKGEYGKQHPTTTLPRTKGHEITEKSPGRRIIQMQKTKRKVKQHPETLQGEQQGATCGGTDTDLKETTPTTVTDSDATGKLRLNDVRTFTEISRVLCAKEMTTKEGVSLRRLAL